MLQPLTLAGALAAASTATSLHPRTPTEWGEQACMTVVDRSVDPVLLLRYTIPFEDTVIPPEEVADSRRHQFFALCRDYEESVAVIPTWISAADIAAAAAVGLVDPDDIDPAAVFASSTTWQGCWSRITDDDERRPITFAAAMEPVVWDTSGLPIGPHRILGYTWEPPFNWWSRRPGVVQVVDDLDPAASPPAIALSTRELTLEAPSATLEGCARAMDGATLTGSFADLAADPLVWHDFITDAPLTGETFTLPFAPPRAPPPYPNVRELLIRVEVVDPLGRRDTAHMDRTALVVSSDVPPTTGEPEPTSGGADTTAGTTDGTTDAAGTTNGGTTSAGDTPSFDGVDRGCACLAAPTRPPTWALLLLLALRRRVRR